MALLTMSSAIISFLTNTKAKWMLIIKKTDFINDLYNKFNIYEYDKNYFRLKSIFKKIWNKILSIFKDKGNK